MRTKFFAALLLVALPAATALAQSPQDQFKAAFEKAQAAEKKAGELRNQWTVTENALKAAKTAADAGDFDKALKLANQAEALANASIVQSEREKTAWKDAVIR